MPLKTKKIKKRFFINDEINISGKFERLKQLKKQLDKEEMQACKYVNNTVLKPDYESYTRKILEILCE